MKKIKVWKITFHNGKEEDFILATPARKAEAIRAIKETGYIFMAAHIDFIEEDSKTYDSLDR